MIMKTYILTMKGFNLIKIGKSKRFKDRLYQLQTANPLIEDVYVFDGDYESYLHRALNHVRVKNEWFDLTDFIDTNIDETIKGLFSMLINNRNECENDCEAILKLTEQKNPH